MINYKTIKFLYIAYDKLKAIGQVGILSNFRMHWEAMLNIKDVDSFNNELKQLFTNWGRKNDTVNVKNTANVKKRRHR